MKIARHVRVTGRVQGVFFRAWTRNQAQALGLAGWVRNCDDGSVEAQVEGEERAVDRLIALIGEGPSGARVDHVDSRETRSEGLNLFEVRR
jgi:acylphosphatase